MDRTSAPSRAQLTIFILKRSAVSCRRADTQGRTGPFHHRRYCFKASLRFACGMRNTKSRTGTPYGWLCRHKAYYYPIVPYFDCIFNLNILRRFLPPNSVWLSQFCLCGSGCGSNEKTAANWTCRRITVFALWPIFFSNLCGQRKMKKLNFWRRKTA